MKSVKKITCILFVALIFISSFSILSFAADSFQATRALGDQVYKVEFISSLDEKDGTIYIEDSTINIYKIPEGSAVSSELVNDKYLYKKVTTDKNGKAELNVIPGTYLIKENNFKRDGKEYQAEFITLNVTEKTNYFTVYSKHSLVSKDNPQQPDTPFNPLNPHTGDSAVLTYAALGVLVASVIIIVVVARKKNKPKNKVKTENETKNK